MTHWPKWLRFTFIISGSLFVIAVLFSAYVLASHAVIPPLSTADPSQPEQPSSEPTSLLNIITAVTGLVTAASGLYGQIVAGRKQEIDYELAKAQMKSTALEP